MTTSQAESMTEVSDSVRQIEAKHGIDSTKSSGMGTGFAFCNMATAMGQFIGPLVAGVAKVGLRWSAMTLFRDFFKLCWSFIVKEGIMSSFYTSRKQ
jgi:hypothetical protein